MFGRTVRDQFFGLRPDRKRIFQDPTIGIDRERCDVKNGRHGLGDHAAPIWERM